MISFSDAAITKLEDAVDPGDFVRVGVVGGGCAGLSYTIEIEENSNPDDVILEIGNVKVCLNPFSAFQLRETIVDYKESLHHSGFKFDNPKAKKSCGCGTSFKPQENPVDAPPEGCTTGGCPSK